MIKEFLCEAALHCYFQRSFLIVVKLHVAEIRTLQLDCRVENFAKQGR
jgi:hypothetical protein